MRTILFLLALALPVASVSAGQTRPPKFDQQGEKNLPVKEPRSDNSCAAYGAGFVKIAGTNTCVKVGGSISVGAGGRIGGR
jgi:porin-like protein